MLKSCNQKMKHYARMAPYSSKLNSVWLLLLPFLTQRLIDLYNLAFISLDTMATNFGFGTRKFQSVIYSICSLNFHSTCLASIYSYKYPGKTLDKNLSYLEHVKYTSGIIAIKVVHFNQNWMFLNNGLSSVIV